MTSKRTPIQTALARAGGQPIEIPVDLGESMGGVVEYAFLPSIGPEIVAKFAAFDPAGSIESKVDALFSFLEAAATGDTAVRIADDWKRRALDLGAMMAIAMAVVEEVTGANPTKPRSSVDGSSTTGGGSTDGAAPVVSMPPPLPPTG